MDFFDHQERARKRTGRLVFFFVLAVLGIIAGVYFLVMAVFGYSAAEELRPGETFAWFRIDILAGVAVGTSALVGCAALFRMSQLSGGGQGVAQSLGGQRVDSASTEPRERQLLNVVEEIAVASGVAVPPVYVLWDEAGINAFAAGFSSRDAVIGVTRGCLEQLNRDELQGVIAHEFSHVLNGDMRINIRLMGVLFGITFITLGGYYLARSFRFAQRGKNNATGGIVLFGVGLMAIGWIGTLFASLIRAAVSRQREFLADASAVQFTRLPAGIGGALLKIGGLTGHAQLKAARAAECSHMFFGDALKRSFMNLWSTHPPLEERIGAILPGLDLQHPTAALEALGARPAEAALGFSSLRGGGSMQVTPDQVVAGVGQPDPLHQAYAAELMNTMDEELKRLVHDPLGARAVAYGLLFDTDPEVRIRQLGLVSREDPLVLVALERAEQRLKQLDPTDRLSLLDLAIPRLTNLSSQQQETLLLVIQGLVRADLTVSLFEFALEHVLVRHLQVAQPGSRAVPIRRTSLRSMSHGCRLVLSALAHAGSEDAAAAESAYRVGADQIEWQGTKGAPELLSPRECGVVALGQALDELEASAPRDKQRFLRACVVTVTTDGRVTGSEAELLRAVAAGIDCPLPPFVN